MRKVFISGDPLVQHRLSLMKEKKTSVEKFCRLLKECNQNIRVASLIAAPEGIQNVREKYPDAPIHLAASDRELNEIGYILPGLGDAGNRQYGTT